MDENTVKTILHNRHTIEIIHDIYNDSSPRDYDNLGTIVTFSRYLKNESNLTEDMFNNGRELYKYLQKEEDAVVIMPIYIYVHSGVTIRTSGAYDCPWDSGVAGFIYATKDDIRENFMVKHVSKKYIKRTKEVLEAEIKEYDQYLRGEVYGFKITNPDGSDGDSCWGFFGDPEESGIVDEAKAYCPTEQEIIHDLPLFKELIAS